MSYIDETYGKQLEEALRGLVSRPALGQPWFGFHASEVPAGVLLFTATTHSRVLYADFWKYIQDKNLVKTEEEWQSIYNAQGWCPFYSDGDGIDTFRMPSAPLYLHGADILGEAGQYVKEGLPNITGGFTVNAPTDVSSYTGAFIRDSSVQNRLSGDQTGTTSKTIFDASLSNSIYGNSQHVTPETSKMLFGIWAISAPQQPIPDATIEGIISELGVASNNALEAKNGLNGVVRSINDVVPDAMGNADIASLASSWGMPSNRYVDVTLGASDTKYVAPANGYFASTAKITDANLGLLDLRDVKTNAGCTAGATGNGRVVRVILPVLKDSVVSLLWNASVSVTRFVFIYANGDV